MCLRLLWTCEFTSLFFSILQWCLSTPSIIWASIMHNWIVTGFDFLSFGLAFVLKPFEPCVLFAHFV